MISDPDYIDQTRLTLHYKIKSQIITDVSRHEYFFLYEGLNLNIRRNKKYRQQ